MQNQFSWSYSRQRAFDECKRKYQYLYYDYWGGWPSNENASPYQTQLYIYKHMDSIPSWAGRITHELLATSLIEARTANNSDHRLPDLLTLARKAQERIQQGWRQSRAGKYKTNPKHACGLIEHELPHLKERADDGITPTSIWLQVVEALRNAYASDVFARLQQSDPTTWHVIDELQTVNIDGHPMYVAPDFVFTNAKGITEVIDWKTGAASNWSENQLAAYLTFMAVRYRVPLDTLQASAVMLSTNPVVEHTLRADAERIKQFVFDTQAKIAEMSELVVHQDLRKNALAAPQARTQDVSKCRTCAFHTMCYPAEVT